MKNLVPLTVVLMLAPAPVAAQNLTEAHGFWMRDDGNARVEIAPCGGDICVTNVWIGDTSGGEQVGDSLVLSLTPKSANTFAGSAYDGKRKRTYSMTLRIAERGLATRGCILGGVVCRTVNWTPAE